jgi:hypothetical protein
MEVKGLCSTSPAKELDGTTPPVNAKRTRAREKGEETRGKRRMVS